MKWERQRHKSVKVNNIKQVTRFVISTSLLDISDTKRTNEAADQSQSAAPDLLTL